MIRIELPHHLRTLARVGREIEIQLEGPTTLVSVLDRLEVQYPMLRGTIRDQVTGQRRPFIRYFACGEDLSLEPSDIQIPDAVAAGIQPLRIVGAMAGG